MFRKPIKISDLPNRLPDTFKQLRENEAIVWMENHRLKYMIGGSDVIYEATGITILDSSNKKIPVTADKVFKITGNYIKKTTVTENNNEVRLDVELNLEGDAILDIMPLATDVNYGITLLNNNSESDDFTKVATSWMLFYNAQYQKQHSEFKQLYSGKPTSPMYGDLYKDSESIFIYNKFLQSARIFGTYVAGERTFAVLYANEKFKEAVSRLPINIDSQISAYRINEANIENVDEFMAAHNIPSNYVDAVIFYTIQAGNGLESSTENGLIYISDWELATNTFQIEQMLKASWQTL